MNANALVLNGFDPASGPARALDRIVGEQMVRLGWKPRHMNVHALKVRPCNGCLGCWYITPGRCVLRDDGDTVAKAYIQSRLAVFLSPVLFGSFASDMKRVLERLIQLLPPHMHRVNGETVHKARYDRYPAMVTIGMLEEAKPDWADTFSRLAARNARNLLAPDAASLVLPKEQTPEAARSCVENLFAPLGGPA